MTDKILGSGGGRGVVVSILCLAALSGCLSADFGAVTQRAAAVSIGSSKDSVVKMMGAPQRIFRNPKNPDLEYLHYCIYGLASDDDNGFYLYRGRVYRRISGVSTATRDLLGVYETNYQPEFNCYHSIKIDWGLAPMPEEILAERNAARKASQKAREESRIRREKEINEAREKAKRMKEDEVRRAEQIVSKEYFIDGLVITTTEDLGADCNSGKVLRVELEGAIGPDSSFALEKLIGTEGSCTDSSGAVTDQITVTLSSLGGLLEDGYRLGKFFRKNSVATRINEGETCASSCAVAFLGGTTRVLGEGASIMFHSPYLVANASALGRQKIDCNIAQSAKNNLLSYYQDMTDVEAGTRLFDRTMSYCSAADGWVLRGPNSALLYGVATE